MNRKTRKKLLMDLTILEAAALNVREEIDRVRTDIRADLDQEREVMEL